MVAKLCSFTGCDKPLRAKALCSGHYFQASHGQELRPLGLPRAKRICDFGGCNNVHSTRGYCSGHAWQIKRGYPLTPLGSTRAKSNDLVIADFESKVNRSGECHRWTGNHIKGGYGTTSYQGVTQTAHRVALKIAGIEVPDEMSVDHVKEKGCLYRDCVRLDHLEIVTHRENVLRSDGIAAKNAQKTHCKRGHEFTPDNTYLKKTGRECKACRVIHKHNFRSKSC